MWLDYGLDLLEEEDISPEMYTEYETELDAFAEWLMEEQATKEKEKFFIENGYYLDEEE